MNVVRVVLTALLALAGIALGLTGVTPARALEPIVVPMNVDALDLTKAVEYHIGAGPKLQTSTATGRDGVVRRIEVQATRDGGQDWVVFALSNTSTEQIDRVIVAPYFRLAGSGIIQPDLGSSRIVAISTSHGFPPEREPNAEADVYAITLDPGAVVTFVVELRGPKLPQLLLWQPGAYKEKVNSYTLFRGIILGISGLLALFLTILFVVKGTVMFPATAMLAWTVLGYLCIDFGFFHRLFKIDASLDQPYRASAEVMLAASMLLFIYAYLNLNRWYVSASHVTIASIVVLIGMLGVAVYDPVLAAGIARFALALIAVAGAGLIAFLALHHSDRAVMLIPTWILFMAWVAGSGLAISGALVNDTAQPALAGGMVLIVMLIGFTVMQHAFAGGAVAQGLVNDMERRALALVGAGDVIWDWDVPRDNIWTSPEAEAVLGLQRGQLESAAREWLAVLHPQDRDRFRTSLDAIIEQRRGRISQVFRLRASDGHYRYFLLRARPVLGSDGEVVRCVGTLLDVTDQKTAEERMLHDAVHDNLTGLPNRELFMDRLSAAIARARAENAGRPSIILIDVDRFKQVNDSLGLSVGDSILLTVARRIARLLKPQDTLARISGDQFAIILLSEQEPERVAQFCDAVRRQIKAPINFGDREIFLTTSIGIAIYDNQPRKDDEIVKDAEVAMLHAKKIGGDRIEAFRPALRQHGQDLLAIESDLRRAVERDEIKLVYQPIIRLRDGHLAGFEALMRWDHPRRGRLSPGEFLAIAERSGLIIPLGLHVLERAAKQLAKWQEELGAQELFCSVNVSSRQVLRHDLINDVKAALQRSEVAPGTLKIEVTESLVMDNPEYAAKVLTRLKELGASLSLDDFGTGYSSLAYLQRFPFDTIKIDQQFVRGDARAARPALLRTIVQMGHDLGMEVVAEGAETEQDARDLRALGCEYAQGFLYGQPLAAEEATVVLQRQFRQAAAQ